jgi:hypothetical protein
MQIDPMTKPWASDFFNKSYELPESAYLTFRVNSNVANYFSNYKAIILFIGFLVASFHSFYTWLIMFLFMFTWYSVPRLTKDFESMKKELALAFIRKQIFEKSFFD